MGGQSTHSVVTQETSLNTSINFSMEDVPVANCLN